MKSLVAAMPQELTDNNRSNDGRARLVCCSSTFQKSRAEPGLLLRILHLVLMMATLGVRMRLAPLVLWRHL